MTTPEEAFAEWEAEYVPSEGIDGWYEDMKAAYMAATERAARIADNITVIPSGLDVDGNMGNIDDNWNHGVGDAMEQIAKEIRRD
jgi:hypothetical protein